MIDPTTHWHSEQHRMDLLREAAEARLARRARRECSSLRRPASRNAPDALQAVLAAAWGSKEGQVLPAIAEPAPDGVGWGHAAPRSRAG